MHINILEQNNTAYTNVLIKSLKKFRLVTFYNNYYILQKCNANLSRHTSAQYRITSEAG